MEQSYSVLMSVYKKEYPAYLKAAIDSIINQTLPPYEIIMVCDGPLTKELEQVLQEYQYYLTLVRLKENVGLGNALAEGLRHCSCQWIARMDTDDIAVGERCEKQMKYLHQHPDVDILSGTLVEFIGEALNETEVAEAILSLKSLPLTHCEIEKYMKKRNPINHPCVMFRKEKVLEAGNYQPCCLFEDYDLWVRMYLKQCTFANLEDILLYMRVNEMHRRRGGWNYAKAIAVFWRRMYQRNVVSMPWAFGMMISRVVVSLLPNRIRKVIYDKKLRNC